MGLLQDLIARGQKAAKAYTGDATFLAGAAAAAALVTRADGQVDEGEITAALEGLTANPLLKSFTASKVDDVFTQALDRSKSRAGKIELQRAIAALAARSLEERQDVLLIGADVADDNGIGAEERKVLDGIAKTLGLDANKLIGEPAKAA